MAPHSSTLAWKIPWIEEPGGLQSVGLQRVGHDCVTKPSSAHGWCLTNQCECVSHPEDTGKNHLTRLCYGLPQWLCRKKIGLQCRRCGFDPWVGKIPWRRKWPPTAVFLPGEPHGQRSLGIHSPRVAKNRIQRSTHTYVKVGNLKYVS